MRQLALAGITLAMLTIAAPLSTTAQADSYYGPAKVGDLCWQRQGHNSLGYWAPCAPARTASAGVPRGKKN